MESILEKKIQKLPIFFFLLICFLSLIFLKAPGQSDIEDFTRWAKNMDEHGIIEGYSINHDMYPPISSMILFSVIKFSQIIGIKFFLGFKISLLIFLLITSLTFLYLTKNLLLTSLLHFSLILNSVGLSYIDIYVAPTLLLSIYFLGNRNYLFFTIFFTISVLIKWQPIIIAPFILVYIIDRNKLRDIRSINIAYIFKTILIPCLALILLFALIFGPELFLSLDRALKENMLSGTALNFNWILSYLLEYFYPDRFGKLIDGAVQFIFVNNWKITVLPTVLFYAFYLIVLITFFKQEKSFRNFLIYSIIGYLSYFVFNTGVHENHLFLASILSLLLLSLDKKLLFLPLIILLMDNVNLLIFYGINGESLPFSRAIGIDFTIILSMTNVIFFICLFIPIIKTLKQSLKKSKISIT